MSLRWVELGEIKDAVADVRSDKTPTNWVLLSYQGENSNDVGLLGKGEGGVNEFISHLQENMVGYGLVRVTERFDNSTTVKFVFINWVGEKIHRMLRARMGTHSGVVKEVLAPYHVTVDATVPSEISEEIIQATVSKASGTAVHVRDAQASSSAPYVPRAGGGGGSSGSPSMKAAGIPKQTENVKFDEDAIRQAIKDVRADSNPTNWVLLTYEGPNSNNIVLAGSGAGGSEELIGHLTADIVAYGLIRQDEKYDDTSRVMFAFINWVGEQVPRMQKARIGTHSGAVKGILTPYHADIDATNHTEVTPEIITSTIRHTMGTATRVRN